MFKWLGLGGGAVTARAVTATAAVNGGIDPLPTYGIAEPPNSVFVGTYTMSTAHKHALRVLEECDENQRWVSLSVVRELMVRMHGSVGPVDVTDVLDELYVFGFAEKANASSRTLLNPPYHSAVLMWRESTTRFETRKGLNGRR